MEETTKIVQIDRAKLEPIVKKAIENGRVISTEGMDIVTWLGLRNIIGIGGSEVATVLGINPYKTAYQLWKEKVSDEVEIIENKYTIWGNILEGPVAEDYAKRNGLHFVKDNKIRIHPEYNCLFVNNDYIELVDGIEKRIYEVKTTSRRNYAHWQNGDTDYCVDGIPLYHYCQVQEELACSPNIEDAVILYAIIDERETIPRVIKRDEEYLRKQLDALSKWWNAFVVPNVPPPMTAAEYSFIEPMADSYIEADGEIADLYANLKGKKETLKALEKDIDKDEDKIKEFIGEKENLVLIDKIIATYKMQSRTSVDSKKLKTDKPDIFTEYSKTTQFRTLRLKEIN